MLTGPQSWIKTTRKGFSRCERRWLFFARCVSVAWSDVMAIEAVLWDCFSSHVFGFRLVLAGEYSVYVTEQDAHWDEFRSQLLAEFPEIDREAIARVESSLPQELEITVWRRQQGGEQVDVPNGGHGRG